MVRVFVLCLSFLLLGFEANTVHAQSWSYSADRATAPAAIAGDRSPGFEIVCYQGEWMMYLFGLPTAEGAPASINVDGQPFPATIIIGNGDDGIRMTGAMLRALQSGRQVQVVSVAPSSSFSATYSLRGSSRALQAVAANCGDATPATAPGRFLSAPPQYDAEATSTAKLLLRDILVDAQRTDPRVGIEAAGFVELHDGWRFLITDIGPSTMLYGVAGFATVIFAAPPQQEWRFVESKTEVAAFIDSQGRTNGVPNLVYQAVRGVNQPYALWSWNGQAYAFERLLRQ